MDQLPEYISSLKLLQEQYSKQIDIQIGLETEYFPSFADYYNELAANKDIQWLVLGQHMYAHSPGVYSFNDTPEVRDQVEYIGLCEAMIEGMNTGLFRVVVHPDRAFRRMKSWNDDPRVAELARNLIDTAINTGTILEQNETSKRYDH